MAGNFTWDGSTSGNWGTGTNWSGGSAPTGSTDVLTFPASGVTNLTMANNLAANLNFNKLTFAQGGYILTGSVIDMVTNGVTNPRIEATNTSGAETLINLPINVQAPLTLSAAAGADLHLGANTDPVLGINTLTLNAAPGGRIELDGATSGSGGIVMTGGGSFIIDASQNTTGVYSLQGGTMMFLLSSIAGPLSTAEGTTVNSIKGVVNGGITILGNLELGFDFTVNGNLVFGNAGTAAERVISFDIDGTLPGFDYEQIEVSGNLVSNSHKIALNISETFAPGTEFILMKKTSAGNIATTTKFRKPDGTQITEGATGFYGSTLVQFSYFGGDGNDFTATVMNPTLQATKDWDGGSTVDNLWSTAANWSSDTLPIAGQALRFGSVATADVIPLHDLPGYVGQFLFTGTGGFTLRDADGAAPVLNYLVKGMTASHATNLCVLEQDLALTEAQTWALTGSGGMRIHETNQTDMGALNLTFNVAPSVGTPSFEMNGVLVGTGNLIKTGPGVLQMGGSAANTFTGTTTINQGEVRLTKTTGNALLGNVTIGDGTNAASLTTTVTQKIADTAIVTVKPNGSFLPGQNETISSLVIDGGTVNAGVRTITLAGDLVANATATFTAGGLSFSGSQNINTATGTTLTLNAAMNSTSTKIGTGTLELLKDSSGALTIMEGTVQVYDSIFLPNLFTLHTNGTLVGEADFGTINAAAGGTLMTDDAGDMTCDSFTGGSTAIFRPNLDAHTLLHMTTGAINLASTRLDPILSTVPAAGTQFMILQNTSAAAITSRFATLSGTVLGEGAVFITPLATFKITYVGGTGNDVVLTAQQPTASATTRVWDGGGATDTNWMTATNWVGDVLPLPGDSLEFPAAHVTSINNFPAGMTFGSISFTGVPTVSARTISGNAIQILGNLSSSLGDNATRVVDISLPTTFLNAATVSNTGLRLLRFNASVVCNAASLTLSSDSASSRVIRFLTSGLISGSAKIIVNGNATADLGSFLNHSYTGGTEVRFGQIVGSAATLYANGLTVGDGTHTASASTGSSSAMASNIIVQPNGTLTASGINVTSLTLNGTPGTPATVNATNVTLATAFSADAGDAATFTSLTAPSLTQNGGSVNITGSSVISGTVRLQSGALTLPNGSSAGRLQVDSGTFSQTGTLTVANDVQVNGGSMTGGGIDFTGAGTHGFEVATTASLQTLGDATFSDHVSKTGLGTLSVSTTLQAASITLTQGILRNDAANIDLNSANRTLIVINGGHLQGNGTVGDISASNQPSTQISPGASPGRLSASSLVVENGETMKLNFEINSVIPATGFDQLLIGGSAPTVSLNSGSNSTGATQLRAHLHCSHRHGVGAD